MISKRHAVECGGQSKCAVKARRGESGYSKTWHELVLGDAIRCETSHLQTII